MDQFSLAEAARIVHVSASRLRYWHRTALVPAALSEGGQPLFGFLDLVCARAVLALLEHGVPLQRIRRSVAALRQSIPELDRPLDSLRVWVDGSERVVIRHEGTLLEPGGQLVLDMLSEPAAGDEVARLEAPARGRPAFERALEHFERGCQLDSDPASYAAAVDAYRAAVAADPSFSDAYCNLGTVHYNRGERELARECYEHAVAYEPAHIEANFNLANLLEEFGENEGALRHYRLALAVDPCYPELHLNLALLYEKLRRQLRATAHWRRYLQLSPEGNWAEVARQRLGKD